MMMTPWSALTAKARLYVAGVVLLAFLAAAGALIAWHVHRVDLARSEGYGRGKAEVTARCDADTILRERLERRRAEDNRARADRESAEHEAARAALAQDLKEARDASRKALRRPISCPAGSSVAVGDVVVPGDALRGLRKPSASDRARPD
jgi:hypothetical protein